MKKLIPILLIFSSLFSMAQSNKHTIILPSSGSVTVTLPDSLVGNVELANALAQEQVKRNAAIDSAVSGISGSNLSATLTNAKDLGAVGDGVTDDAAKLNTLLSTKGKKVLEKGKTYLVQSQVSITADDVELDMNTAKIISGASFPNTSTSVLTNVTSATYTSGTLSIPVVKGSRTFTMSTGASNITPGQLVNVKGGYSYSTIYDHGWYSPVDSVVGTTVYMSIPAPITFTGTSVIEYTTSRNIKIKNGTLELGPTKTLGYGITIKHAIGTLIENMTVTSKGAEVAMNLSGINGLFQHNTIHGFSNSVTQGTGYGISSSGHNMISRNNYITGCRHSVTSATRDYYSENISYYDNYMIGDGQDSPLDWHGNVLSGSAEGNFVYSFGLNAVSIRSGGKRLKDNKIFLDYKGTNTGATISGVVMSEMFNGNTNFEGNHIEVVSKGVATTFWALNFSNSIDSMKNVSIINNPYIGGIVRVIADTTYNFRMSGNTHFSTIGVNGGISLNNTKGFIIENETFNNYVDNTFHYDINLDTGNGYGVIRNNTFNKFNAANNQPNIRMSNNRNLVYGNTLFSESSSTSTAITSSGVFIAELGFGENWYSDNKKITNAGVVTPVYRTTVPAASAWFNGKIIEAGTTSTSTFYMGKRTGASTYTWAEIGTAL